MTYDSTVNTNDAKCFLYNYFDQKCDVCITGYYLSNGVCCPHGEYLDGDECSSIATDFSISNCDELDDNTSNLCAVC